MYYLLKSSEGQLSKIYKSKDDLKQLFGEKAEDVLERAQLPEENDVKIIQIHWLVLSKNMIWVLIKINQNIHNLVLSFIMVLN